IDVTIPEGALTPEAEKRLCKELTDILIRAEGYTPETNKVAQSVTWLFLHRPAAVYRAGEPSDVVRYRGAGGPIHRRSARVSGKGMHRGGGTRAWRQEIGCRAFCLGVSD